MPQRPRSVAKKTLAKGALWEILHQHDRQWRHSEFRQGRYPQGGRLKFYAGIHDLVVKVLTCPPLLDSVIEQVSGRGSVSALVDHGLE